MSICRLVIIFLFSIISSQVIAQSSVIKVSSETTVKDGRPYYEHEVQKGQTLYSIARAYEVPVSEIIAHNPGSGQVIKIGQTILIPSGKNEEDTNGQQPVSPPSSNNTKEEASENPVKIVEGPEETSFHKVEKGETLYSLSMKYGIPVSEIIAANPGAENVIKIGQELVIPGKGHAEGEKGIDNNSEGKNDKKEKEKSQDQTLDEAGETKIDTLTVPSEIPDENLIQSDELAEDTGNGSIDNDQTTPVENLEVEKQLSSDSGMNASLTSSVDSINGHSTEIDDTEKENNPSSSISDHEDGEVWPNPTLEVTDGSSKNFDNKRVVDDAVPTLEEKENNNSSNTYQPDILPGPGEVVENLKAQQKISLLDYLKFQKFCSKKFESLKNDPSWGDSLNLNEYFFFKVNPSGVVYEISDERTETNNNTFYLTNDDIKEIAKLKFIPAEKDGAPINAKASIGVIINIHRTTYEAKVKKNKIKIENKELGIKTLEPGHPHFDIIMSEIAREGHENGKYLITVIEGDYNLSEYERHEYNPFSVKVRSLFYNQFKSEVYISSL